MSTGATSSATAMNKNIAKTLCTAVETLINTLLRYDPSSRQQIARINGVLAIELTAPTWHIYVYGQDETIALRSECEMPVSATITGSASALLALLQQPTTLAHSGVSLTGSVRLLQQWQAVLHNLDIDWEDAINEVTGETLGDMAAPVTIRTVKRSIQWVNAQIQEQQRLLGEYLTEERQVIPSKPETDIFFDQVDQLKLKVDRITARIHALKNSVRP